MYVGRYTDEGFRHKHDGASGIERVMVPIQFGVRSRLDTFGEPGVIELHFVSHGGRI